MLKKIFLTLGILLFMSLFFPITARADGIIIPEPPICMDGPCPPPPCQGPFPCPPLPPSARLAVKYHHVTVTIQDQVAVTQVDQVFFNPNPYAIEGTYMFPLPLDATVSSFVLWVDGKPVEGKVLDADAARQAYEEVVRSLRDPALLEYANRGAVQAHIFPIPANGERRVELEYTQALAAEGGLVRYVYPLNTEKFSAWPLDDVTINVDIKSSAPIRAVYSPSHPVDITKEGVHHVRAGYEENNVRPDKDFALYYSLGEDQAFHLLSFRATNDPADADGFFLLLLAPTPDADTQTLPKDVLLVLDRSGSMDGEKFQQAQKALSYILKHLNPEDRFNIVTFSTGVDSYKPELRPANEANDALTWVDELNAQGSTDIDRALSKAAKMADEERPTYLIFLTDGLPTIGIVDSAQILQDFSEAAPKNVRLFAFGVGYDVDTFLLDSLTQAHHGASSYVLQGENLDTVLSAFYEKISMPVLTNLSLDFGEASVYDLYPTPLPDLFLGSQIIVVGRYRPGVSQTTVTLTGNVNEQQQTFRFANQALVQESSAEEPALNALPRLWATRKIGSLLSQIRLTGANQETIDQIVRLSIRYGIVTPYTSYLVTETMPLGAEQQSRIAQDQYNKLQVMPTSPTSGQAAVQEAIGQGGMAGADAPAAVSQEAQNVVRIVDSRAFVLSNGVWVDTAFDPEKMTTAKVAFLSVDYFALSQARADLAAAFALGQRVIVVSDGVAYEVVDQGTVTKPLQIPVTQTPAPVVSTPIPGQPTPPISQEKTPTLPVQGNQSCATLLLPIITLLSLVILKRG